MQINTPIEFHGEGKTMKKQILTISKLICLGDLAISVAVASSPVQGMPTEADIIVASASHQQGPTDPRELEAFLDPIFAKQMGELHIPGAVFVLVKDGKVFFAKGYGYANIQKRTPVIPDRTIFRVASVSKLLTTTAVMQLVERGLLNLDDDVNKYVKSFKLEKKKKGGRP